MITTFSTLDKDIFEMKYNASDNVK